MTFIKQIDYFMYISRGQRNLHTYIGSNCLIDNFRTSKPRGCESKQAQSLLGVCISGRAQDVLKHQGIEYFPDDDD